MKTSKPISTISFNTQDYALGVLKNLTLKQVIEFWVITKHKGEPDESNDEVDKDHFHIYMEPARLIQTMDLKEAFKEIDPGNPKPLGVIDIRSSKFDDWYLYALHDPAYLASKKQSRVYHYSKDDMITSNEDELNAKVSRIDIGAMTPYVRLEEYIRDDKEFGDFVLGEQINPRDIYHYERAWYLMTSMNTNRNGREGHPNEMLDE